MKKKMFNVLACVALAAVLTVSICAANTTVSVGSVGSGYLNSFTGSSYAETVGNTGGIIDSDYVAIYLYINGSLVNNKKNVGKTYTTAWVTYAGSGSTVSADHYIQRNGAVYGNTSIVYP